MMIHSVSQVPAFNIKEYSISIVFFLFAKLAKYAKNPIEIWETFHSVLATESCVSIDTHTWIL